jgi:hypothetical protein
MNKKGNIRIQLKDGGLFCGSMNIDTYHKILHDFLDCNKEFISQGNWKEKKNNIVSIGFSLFPKGK